MKRFILVSMIAAILGLASSANASLVAIDTNNMFIYDTDLDITWYNAVLEYRTWAGAMDWAASLTVGNTVAGSWSLPTTEGATLNTTPATSYDGSTVIGYNNTSSKLGHLYYTELNNVAEYSGTSTALKRGPFWLYHYYAGLLEDTYWTSTNQTPIQYAQYNGIDYPTGNVWIFDFSDGRQGYTSLGDPAAPTTALALAYHEGRVGAPVPVPATAWLLGSGLVGLINLRRRLHK